MGDRAVTPDRGPDVTGRLPANPGCGRARSVGAEDQHLGQRQRFGMRDGQE
jgi:hypothetical protein